MRKPYAFTFNAIDDETCIAWAGGNRYRVGCQSWSGSVGGVHAAVKDWSEALEYWEASSRSWGRQSNAKPLTRANVSFVDETGEHTVDELFGKAPAKQGVLL